MSLSPTSIDPYVQVGNSGLVVYRVGLGSMQFGWTTDEEASFAVMDTYAEAGGNFIDTADCYTAWSASMGGPENPGGVSEEIIGRWMVARNNRNQRGQHTANDRRQRHSLQPVGEHASVLKKLGNTVDGRRVSNKSRIFGNLFVTPNVLLLVCIPRLEPN